MKLNELPIGGKARIISVQGDKTLKRHLLEMGLTLGTALLFHKAAPMGDPMEPGSRQHVGNFPGVTVDRKSGTIRSHQEAIGRHVLAGGRVHQLLRRWA